MVSCRSSKVGEKSQSATTGFPYLSTTHTDTQDGGYIPSNTSLLKSAASASGGAAAFSPGRTAIEQQEACRERWIARRQDAIQRQDNRAAREAEDHIRAATCAILAIEQGVQGG